MANNSDKQAKNVTAGSEQAESGTSEKVQTQTYFLPEYNVSVEATSLEEAEEKAKELKGVK